MSFKSRLTIVSAAAVALRLGFDGSPWEDRHMQASNDMGESGAAMSNLQSVVADAPARFDTAKIKALARSEQIKTHAPRPHHEEVRLAMALNGGVSLAVWMGGVAVELDCARRSHLGVEPVAGKPERTIYNAICTAFDRSLVLDILSGASAGGLNGALLAAAIRKGRRLPADLLRSKWVGIGEFLSLLQPMSRRDPSSLMRGGSSKAEPGIFYKELRTMFGAILDTDDASDAERDECVSAQAVAPLDAILDVMMTNVQGEPRRFRDVWGFELAARDYRSPLRFQEDGQFTVDNLTAAARVSASFPVAFEPFKVEGTAAGLAGFEGSRYGIDGGLLENAPIDSAIRLIPSRPARSDVKRFVCYLNAAPPTAESADQNPSQPSLANVLGYVVNLPRDARFVEQLYAVTNASRRAAVAASAQPGLIKTSWEPIRATALALLPTYRSRRCILTLEELLGDPAQAEAAFDSVPDGALVPWLPTDLEVPSDGAQWTWGIRAAERVLHLEVDLLRRALKTASTDEVRSEVLEARIAIYASLAMLATYRETFLRIVGSAVASELDPLTGIHAADLILRSDVFDALMSATEVFIGVAQAGRLGDITNPETIGGAIFGAVEVAEAQEQAAEVGADSDVSSGDAARPEEVEPIRQFLRRALATEVINRAFATDEDIAPGQRLLFAQLTPLAPTRIFSSRPFDDSAVPDSGNDKLTGTLFMHFSGFYRRSWRANDFMWGRLDGATRIVDLLVDTQRARTVAALAKIADASEAVSSPALVLRDAILPEQVSKDERHALVEESFRDARRNDSGVAPAVRAVLADYAVQQGRPSGATGDLFSPTAEPTLLRQHLLAALEKDLEGGDARFTRVICARALQLEVLREELEHLSRETDEDQKLGCFTPPLRLPNDLREAISKVRSYYSNDGSLPKVLGRDDPDEATSDLALETASHALFVALAALRGVNVVLGKIVSIGRAPLLPVSGIASRRLRDRAGVVAGFAAAATYIAARLTTANADQPAPLGSLWSPPVLLSWIALLGILGVVLVPGLRAIRTDETTRRLAQGGIALALLGTAIALPIGLAAWRGSLGFAQIVATPGAFGLPAWLTAVMFSAVLVGPPLLRLPFVPSVIKNRLQPQADKVPLTLVIGIPAGFVAGWSAAKLIGMFSLHTWQGVVALASVATVLLFALYLFAFYRSGRRIDGRTS